MCEITPSNPSKSATVRVLDKLPKPTACNVCEGKDCVTAELNSIVYGKLYGQYPWIYYCSHCKSYVGIHSYTDIPLGTLADYSTREARKKAKSLFFDWSKDCNLDRSAAYAQLAQLLQIPREQCHFGWFSSEMCAKVVKLLNPKCSR